jgi:hypothetical protein
MTSRKSCYEIAGRLLSILAAAMILAFSSLGARAESDVCPGTHVAIHTSGFAPYIRLRVGGKEGWFAIDTASSYSIIDSQTIGMFPGESKNLDIVGLPYITHEAFTAQDWHDFRVAGGQQLLGLIGENVLSLLSVQFHYEDGDTPYLVVSPDSCSPQLENNPDFVKIDQSGFYTRDLSHLKKGEPNLPRFYVQIADVRALAYLDSAAGDASMIYSMSGLTGAVHMNNPFMVALQNTNTKMSDQNLPAPVPCSDRPISPLEKVWTVNQPLHITDADGNVLFQYSSPTKIEPVPIECPDIYYNPHPFGLIPASYIRRWGTVILDAPGEAVWIRKGGTETTLTLPKSDMDWRPEEGTGSYTDIAGDRYEGNFHNGLPEGHGVLIHPNGDHYEGNFHNGLPEGHGTYTWQNGQYYDGDFQNGFLEGNGVLIRPNGDRYEGDFHNNQPEGRGTYTWRNGDRYYGEFKNWLPNGYGTYVRAIDGFRWSGLFRNGNLVAPR